MALHSKISNASRSSTTQHWSHLLCTLRSSKQWKTKHLPYVPKPILKKLCEKDPANWEKYINQVLTSYRVTPNLATVETPFFLVYGRDPNLTLHQLLEQMQWFLGDPESRLLNLEAHWLALAMAKKILDEDHFRPAQKTMDRELPSFKLHDRVYFKNKQPGNQSVKWRPGYRIVHIEHDGHYLHIENQATGKTRSCNIKDVVLKPPVEFWNINTQFSRACKYINHPANLPTITLKDWRWTPYSCTKSPVSTCTHCLYSILYMITLISATVTQESWESVWFQLVLKAYPMHHSWIITVHVSLGNLEKQWRMIIRQM